MLRKILMTAVSIVVGMPAQAGSPSQLEVLGVHLADDVKTVDIRLFAQGYKVAPSSVSACRTLMKSAWLN